MEIDPLSMFQQIKLKKKLSRKQLRYRSSHNENVAKL